MANKPLLYYAVEAVARAGITQVGIVVNPDTQDEIKKSLGRGEQWGVDLTYVLQEAPIGLAHVVKVAEPFIGNDPFIFYLGDNVIIESIQTFVDQFIQKNLNCQLVLARVKDPERFGVPQLQDGRIVRVEEKPLRPQSPFAVTGIYIYDHHIWEAVNSIKPSARGELEITDAHQYLIDRGYAVGYAEITGWWKDTGKPEDLLEANRLILDKIAEPSEMSGEVDRFSDLAGKVILGKGAKIIRSRIRGPVIIGENTVIEDSYIGPFTSIYHDCEIRNSEVEYSIVLEKCRMIDTRTRIECSLLGREAEIVRCQAKPLTQKFIVGDQSRIELT